MANVDELSKSFAKAMTKVDITQMAKEANAAINNAVHKKDLAVLLKFYDNKELFALAATLLKKMKLADFESWLPRALKDKKKPTILKAFRDVIPKVTPQ